MTEGVADEPSIMTAQQGDEPSRCTGLLDMQNMQNMQDMECMGYMGYRGYGIRRNRRIR